jgi:SAM-dependent methyltransferase
MSPLPGTGVSDLAWPGELEAIGTCPVCGKFERRLLFDDLSDNTFHCAPGRWTLWRCSSCGSKYLDPRPSPASISLAYLDYFTHADADRHRSLRAWLGQKFSGARKGGLAWVLGGLRRRLARESPRLRAYRRRYLPRLRPGHDRVLDVGCGNGAFLALAAGLGWKGVGCDFDPVALARASAFGLDVRHGGPEVIGADEQFDHVTLNHVIEHVHRPVEFLRRIREHMRPSARIFIDTPNADAPGFDRFGRNWRGLETPRHLAIFTWDSLEQALAEAGFGNVDRHPQPQVREHIWKMSARMEAGFGPYDEQAVLPVCAVPSLAKLQDGDANDTEFITLTAIA